MEWIKTSKRMPEKQGQYITLYVRKIGNVSYGYVELAEYAIDLEKEDPYAFYGKRYPGFYSEDVYEDLMEVKPDYWMPIPKMPEGVILN